LKSYFLEGLIDEQSARCALSKALPGQVDPWLPNSEAGDPIAYFDVEKNEDGIFCIQADVSGRHFDQDERISSVLQELRCQLGGTVTNGL
jgi:hypothetical protein